MKNKNPETVYDSFFLSRTCWSPFLRRSSVRLLILANTISVPAKPSYTVSPKGNENYKYIPFDSFGVRVLKDAKPRAILNAKAV